MDIETKQNLLYNLRQMVEVSQNRGCWKASEMKDIGLTYQTLLQFIKEIENKLNPDQNQNQNSEHNTEHNTELIKEV